MSNINFDNVYLLFIAIPLVVLLVIPFAVAIRKENASGHNIASCALHIIMAVLVAFGAAGTSIVTVMTETNVYVVADVSYSANRNLDVIDGYIAELSNNLPANSKLGVVCYGKTPKLLSGLGSDIKSVKLSEVDDSETNTVSALEYTGKLFKEGVIKRIVLITDGADTDVTDSNALKRTVDNLNSAGIYVDAIFLDDNIDENAVEVQVSGVDYSQSVYLNHTETVDVTVESSIEALQNFKINLYKNGVLYASKAESLVEGTNVYTFNLDTSETGSYDYEVRVEYEGDMNPYNNSMSFTQEVSGNVNVLYIGSSYNDVEILKDVYGEKSQLTAYVNDPNVPCTVEELCFYDEIILSDIDATTLNNTDIFLESLDTAVSLFGKSLLTFGDTGIQRNTDGSLKRLDDMLPVRYGKSKIDARLLTIVIDASISMKMQSKLIAAQEAAKQLVDLLDDTDSVCVVSFDGSIRVAYPVSGVGDGSAVKAAIDNITAAQGTLIGSGLDAAFEEIGGRNFANSELVLISDGVTYSNETENALDIAQKIVDNGITISVFDVGRDSLQTADETTASNLLNEIARIGGTGSSFKLTADNVKDIVLSEFANELTQTEYDIPAAVTITRRYDEVLDGINQSMFDDDYFYIYGFITSLAKTSARTVFSTTYNNAEMKSETVPIYAYWDYGNGKVASLATTLDKGIAGWRGNGLAEAFLTNVLDINTPAVQRDYPYTVETISDGAYTTVKAIPAILRYDAAAQITVCTPDGETVETRMIFDSESYNYMFLSTDTGKYTVEINYSYAGHEYTSRSSFYVSYPAEYDSFNVFTASPLHKMLVGGSGTVSEDGKLSIVNDEEEIGVRTVSLAAPLMIAVVALFAVDIIIRKLKWNDIKNLFVKVNK